VQKTSNKVPTILDSFYTKVHSGLMYQASLTMGGGEGGGGSGYTLNTMDWEGVWSKIGLVMGH